ncbi:HlyD family type I secretion periplasmic adaptor subunit [uncultured Hoeflea sp.]|uniref:HlyD family type I secretion periplasmic adaptor subunit n=1 Tax=uncultured Hoeflea sp. TaxID=538666 RepID=UPI0030D6CFB5|tara:strand:+ start:218 stop:1528 length:1311 start_codon:yes stop_codon:yes gene_type:complete
MHEAPSDIFLAGSIRKHLIFALALAVILVGGVGGWAANMEISGAVVASGTVVVESNSKQVQHREGGIVREITVRDGDVVKAGDLLIRLDDTVTRANFTVVLKQLDELYAQEARLLAERDNTELIVFSPKDGDVAGTPKTIIEDSQIRLMEARRNSLRGRKQQLGEQIRQLEQQIEGVEVQLGAKKTEISLVEEELGVLEKLLEDKLVGKTRVTTLRREKAQLEGDLGGLISQAAQAQEAISERKIQILQIEAEARAEVLELLQEVRSRIAQLEEQKIAAEDELSRVEIRAPRSGYVHQLAQHTLGGVVGPGETLMLIVPKEDLLVVEVRIQPANIDQLSPRQQATLRFPSFDQRTTPELKARLLTVSADLTTDEASGLSYYTARLTIPEAELAKLNGKHLVPGMPVEAFLKTDDRTVLSYLVKPVSDQIAHALKER